MVGDDRKALLLELRQERVQHLFAHAREDAEQFLLENAGGDVCVRYYQRADGTIMTSDCSVGVTRSGGRSSRSRWPARVRWPSGGDGAGAPARESHDGQNGDGAARPSLPVTVQSVRGDGSPVGWHGRGPARPIAAIKPLPRKRGAEAVIGRLRCGIQGVLVASLSTRRTGAPSPSSGARWRRTRGAGFRPYAPANTGETTAIVK